MNKKLNEVKQFVKEFILTQECLSGMRIARDFFEVEKGDKEDSFSVRPRGQSDFYRRNKNWQLNLKFLQEKLNERFPNFDVEVAYI